MLNDEILTTIEMAHAFGSAFTRDQVYRFLRTPVSKESFNERIDALVDQKIIAERNSRLMRGEFDQRCLDKKRYSEALLRRYRFDLKLLSRLPWVVFIGLTGANAFESCKENDDIDLLLVTNVDKLWITYLMIVLFGKITGKREKLCLNYLVDEKNLSLIPKNYYAAVQLAQMRPLYNKNFRERLISKNMWLFNYLPNAADTYGLNHYDRINGKNDRYNQKPSRLLSRLNRFIYQNYRKRLERKYPEQIGKGIVLDAGVAKLHRVDHRHIYDKNFQVSRERAVS